MEETRQGPSDPSKEGCVLRQGHCLLTGEALSALSVSNQNLFFCFPGQLGEKQVSSSTSDDRVKDEFSDLSEG